MAAQLTTGFIVAIAVVRAANGVIWARNTPELSNKTELGSELSSERGAFRLELAMGVEDRDYPEEAVKSGLVNNAPEPERTVEPSNIRISLTNSEGAQISSVQISPHFVIIYTELLKQMSVGIILNQRTVLTTCASTLVFVNGHLFSIKTSMDVRIVNKSNCGRLCGYMIPQCEPQIGGYFVQFVNAADRASLSSWLAEAALLCDGGLYGVVKIVEFSCDASLAGSTPKPEAVLHMHLSTLKFLADNQTRKPKRKRPSAAATISKFWAFWVPMIAIWVFFSKL